MTTLIRRFKTSGWRTHGVVCHVCDAIHWRRTAGALAFALSLALSRPVLLFAQQPAEAQTGTTTPQVPTPPRHDSDSGTKKEKRGELVIAPIPVSSDAVGSGLALVMGYVFQFDPQDKISPPSMIGGAGAYTSNGSRGGAFGAALNLKQDRYRIAAFGGNGSVNYEFFGSGNAAGAAGRSLPINQGGTAFLGQFLVRTWGWHLGPRFQWRRLTARFETTPDGAGGIEIPPAEFEAKTVAFGPHLLRDRRDSTFYPRTGSVFKADAAFFAPALGSKFSYRTFQVAYNNYASLSQSQVLAFRVMGCGVGGQVPFYDLCLFGLNNDLRGYTAGQFRDRRMFATQLEYRLELTGRMGVAAFAGVGGIAPEISKFRGDELLPSGGGGFRLTVAKKNHINLRLDFGFGTAGHTFSMGVGESF